MLGVCIKLTIDLKIMDNILGMSSLVLLHSDFSKCNGYYEKRQCVKGVQIWSFFWSAFSGIRTEYGEIHRREKTDEKKFRIWTLFKQSGG